MFARFSRRRMASSRVWLAWLLAAVSAAASTAGARAADPASWFPAGAVGYAELNGLGSLAEPVRGSVLWKAWLASPPYQKVQETPAYRKAQALRALMENQLDRDAWTVIADALGGTLAAALYPSVDHDRPELLVIGRVADPAFLAHVRECLDPLLVLADERVRITELVGGQECITIADQLELAWWDDWLVLSSSAELRSRAIEQLSGAAADSLAAEQWFTAVQSSLPSEGIESGGRRWIRACLNLEALRREIADRIPEKMDNPLGSLLLSDSIARLRRSLFLALTVDQTGKRLIATLTMGRDGQPLGPGHRAFVPPSGEPGVVALPQTAGQLAAIGLYRDFADWYRHREALLQEQVLPGFDVFEAGLANLLPGKDFGEDILPLLGRRLTILASPQDYSHLGGEPGLKLPGFAAVIELAEPDEASSVLQLFFQTLSAVLNLQAGQQGREPWVMASEQYRDVTVWYARFLDAPAGERLGVEYNFLPAAARVGDYFVISSSRGLVHQLVEPLESPQAAGARRPRTFAAEVHLPAVADFLDANSQFFEARRLQQGRTAEQASGEFLIWMAALRQLDGLRLGTLVGSDSHQVVLEGSWK